MKAILLDIEGTTTPIDFVHKTLFPYAKEKIGEFVLANWVSLSVEVAQLTEEFKTELEFPETFDCASPDSIAKYLRFLIDADRKSTPLKSIQGKLWLKGYESGELRSIVYDDVPAALERWFYAGETIAIYSSGSVLAQKLIFRYSNHGDLTPFISAYFDTNIGAKRETASYEGIACELGTDRSKIKFFSDIVAELDAAKRAGFQTTLVERGGHRNADKENGHARISTFRAE